MRRILVTGANGMLGSAVANELSGHRCDLYLHTRAELDVTDLTQVRSRIGDLRPDVVINCAAYTRVDDCEQNQEIAFTVNAFGARNLAVACAEAGAALLHVSTDYVFAGDRDRPYREYDQTAPLSVYGESKLYGEEYVRSLCPRHWIVRTQWLFGPGGQNFVRTILRLAQERDRLSVVNDQFGSPTYTVDLATALVRLSETPSYGTYHLTNQSSCNWFDFASEIVRLAGRPALVTPTTTDQFPRPARRPRFSVLDNFVWRLEGRPLLRDWREALHAYLRAEGEAQ